MDHRREEVSGAPPAPPSQSAATGSSSGQSPSIKWPMYTHPPDGFLSLLGNPQTPPVKPMQYPFHVHPPQQGPENLHFVGVPSQVAYSTPPPPPLPPQQHSKRKKSASQSASGRGSSKKKPQVVELEDDPEPGRSAQRLNWTQLEEKRLASAWLELSTNPIEGNGKKRDKYWDDIAVQYNSLTESDRHRDAGQLKSHFQKVKRKINLFHGEYIAVSKIYTSGYGEEQLQALALEKYEANQSSAFQHLTMWRELKDNGKWLAAMRKMNGEKDTVDIASGVSDVDHEERPMGRDVDHEERPMGRDAAKAERSGKRKSRESEGVSVLGEKLDMFIAAQEASRLERQKIIDSQHQLSSQQLETAKLSKETKMIDLYQKLLFADTRAMDDDAKAERAKAMACMSSMLFPQGK